MKLLIQLKLFFILLVSSVFLFGFTYFSSDISKSEKYVDNLYEKIIKYFEKEYPLISYGSGGEMYQGNIKQLYLAFQVKSPKTKDELRQLVYECMNYFLYQVNRDKKIRPYLAEYPCSFANVEIDIFNDIQETDKYTSISSVTFVKNNFIFFYDTPSNSLYRVEESFEEAMKYLNLECH